MAGKSDTTKLTPGQREYEARRAAKAGMTLEKFMASKERERAAEEKAAAKAAEPPKPAKPPGMLSRLIDRAHQPLKKTAPVKAMPQPAPARTSRKRG